MPRLSVKPNDVALSVFAGLSARFWALIALTGVAAGISAGLLMRLLRAVQHICYHYTSGNFQIAAMHVSPLRRVLVLLIAGCVAALVVWALKKRPGGEGYELTESVWFRSGRTQATPLAIQAVLAMTLVGMGGSLGRERSPKQMAAAFATLLMHKVRLSPSEGRLLLACAAGAGMGAVYNVPLGGALFALEVLLGTLSLPLVPPAVAASGLATAVSWLVIPDHPTYHVAHYTLTPGEMVWSLLIGPLAGCASVAFVRAIAYAHVHKPRHGPKVLLPIVVFTALGALAIPFPQLLGNGRGTTQLLFLGQIATPILVALLVLKPLATAACLGSGAPGGLFTPSITYGALLGGLLGHLWSGVWPGAPPGSYAIIGATAVLAAAMQAPLAALVLMVELTHHILALMVPMLLAVTGATVTARAIDARSVYSARVTALRRLPPVPVHTLGQGGEEISGERREPMSVGAPYTEILERIAAGGAREPVYVVDEQGLFAGWVMPQALETRGLMPVLQVGAVGDVVTRVQPLHPRLSASASREALTQSPCGELPLVAPDGRLLAVVRRDPA